MINFEWDENKAQSNLSKHEVSFEEASEVFSDELSYCVADPDHSVNESRYLLFGSNRVGSCLVVSFAENSDTIRIISARKMTKPERKSYEQ